MRRAVTIAAASAAEPRAALARRQNAPRRARTTHPTKRADQGTGAAAAAASFSDTAPSWEQLAEMVKAQEREHGVNFTAPDLENVSDGACVAVARAACHSKRPGRRSKRSCPLRGAVVTSLWAVVGAGVVLIEAAAAAAGGEGCGGHGGGRGCSGPCADSGEGGHGERPGM